MTYKKPARCEIIFKGRVQGVGFRATTVSIATTYRITGYVENLHDLTVHMAAEGRQEDVTLAIHTVRKAMANHITEHSETWSEGTGEFPDFRLRRQAP